MKVVWKDSNARDYKPVRYRKHTISGYHGGWITDLPGDNNIYRSHYCALNAIDKALGGYGQMGTAKRKSFGIQIIGQKSEIS